MRSGFVGLIGRPNAGKSTLLNALINAKIAIVSEKPQTTRSEIRGILNRPECQIIFTDTPGIHKGRYRLDGAMNKQAESVMAGVDLIYLVADGTAAFGKGDEFVLNMVKNTGLPVFLLLNKIDRLKPEQILTGLSDYERRFGFAQYFPVSALNDDDFEDLIRTTASYLPEGDILYPDTMDYDGSEDFRIAELIREKVLIFTEEEVPHACAVFLESKEFYRKACYIQAVITVERESQKVILIGKHGGMLKKIGTAARADIEKLLGRKVFLELYVRVEDAWRTRDNKIMAYGYGGPAERGNK